MSLGEGNEHPTKFDLENFSLGKDQADSSPKLETHLKNCKVCCDTLLQIEKGKDAFVEQLRSVYTVRRRSLGDPRSDTQKCMPGDDPYGTYMDGNGNTAIEATSPKKGTPEKEFGDFDQLKFIAQGGMGVVYKARQRSLNRIVALKMIRSDMLGTKESIHRFYQEARAAAALDHPNIVPIFDIAEHANHHYYTMAYVAGDRLTDKVSPGKPLSARQAVEFMLPVVDAVEYAHSHGIIHRDLKPDNILIDSQGRPRVTDFGLAKQVQSDSNLTANGAILGTPSYMAPEQALGNQHETAPATDVYALGGILYYLLTTRPPFVGSTTTLVLSLLLTEPPTPLRELNKDVPARLCEICERCLAKKPGDRYTSAAALRDDLNQFLRAEAKHSESSTTKSKRGRFVLAGVGLAAMLAIGVGIYSNLPSQKTSEIQPNRVNPIEPDKVVAQNVSVVAWPELKHKDFPLKIEMVGSRTEPDGTLVVTEGDRISFRITTGREAFVGVWNMDAENKVAQLLPNDHESDAKFQANQARVFPAEGMTYTIEAVPSTGIDYVRVIATSKPWQSLPGEKAGPFRIFQDLENRKQLTAQLRSLVIKSANASDDAIAEAELRFKVVPK